MLPCRLEMDFTLGHSLGKGGFAHVYEVASKLDGGSYALKIVQLPNKYDTIQTLKFMTIRLCSVPHKYSIQQCIIILRIKSILQKKQSQESTP